MEDYVSIVTTYNYYYIKLLPKFKTLWQKKNLESWINLNFSHTMKIALLRSLLAMQLAMQ